MLFGRNQKNPITIADKQVEKWTYSTCGYCSTGCSIEIGTNKEGIPVSSRGVGSADVNQGKLCLKGIFEHELLNPEGWLIVEHPGEIDLSGLLYFYEHRKYGRVNFSFFHLG